MDTKVEKVKMAFFENFDLFLDIATVLPPNFNENVETTDTTTDFQEMHIIIKSFFFSITNKRSTFGLK